MNKFQLSVAVFSTLSVLFIGPQSKAIESNNSSSNMKFEIPEVEHGMLSLRSKHLSDADIINMAPDFPKDISAMDLSRNTIGADGIKALLPHFAALYTLNLAHNKLGDEGVSILMIYLKSNDSDLTDLDLRDNHISEEGIKIIASNLPKNLNRLLLDSTDIGVEAETALNDVGFVYAGSTLWVRR